MDIRGLKKTLEIIEKPLHWLQNLAKFHIFSSDPRAGIEALVPEAPVLKTKGVFDRIFPIGFHGIRTLELFREFWFILLEI